MINQVFKKRAVYSDFAKSGAQYRLKRSSSVRVSGQNNKGKKALHATRVANQILPKMITTVGGCQVGSQIAQKKCTMSTFPVLSSDSIIPSSNITYFLFTSWYVFRRPHFNRCFYIIREVKLFFLLLLSESIILSLWKLIMIALNYYSQRFVIYMKFRKLKYNDFMLSHWTKTRPFCFRCLLKGVENYHKHYWYHL